MAFNSSPVRRLLPIAIILFDFILTIISIVNLASGFAIDSYVSASYLVCITSILAILCISVIALANHRQPTWMPYAYAFELAWVSIILVLQLIGAAAMSADSITSECASHGPFTVRGHDICPSHRATLAFGWTAFLLAIAHLALLIVHLTVTAPGSFFEALTSAQSDNEQNDTEKALPSQRPALHSASSSLDSFTSYSATRPNKHRPAPLNLGKVSVTALPIYNARSKKDEKKQRARTQAEAAPRPNRHELMMAALAMSNNDNGNSSKESLAADGPYVPGHHRNASSTSDWAPPTEWHVVDPNSSKSSVNGTLKNFLLGNKRASKQLPAVPGQAVTYASRAGNPAPQMREARPSMINRPDPRNRAPLRAGELAAEGGFWPAAEMSRI